MKENIPVKLVIRCSAIERMSERTKRFTQQEVEDLILSDTRFVQWALLFLYSEQTAVEKVSQKSIGKNGRGFSGPDAKPLSLMAESLIKTGSLTAKQIVVLRKQGNPGYSRLGKYRRQLCRELNRLLEEEWLRRNNKAA